MDTDNSLNSLLAFSNKKAMLPQGNSAMPP